MSALRTTFPGHRVQEWASQELELGSASLIISPGHSMEHQSLRTTALGHVSWREKQENWAINTCLCMSLAKSLEPYPLGSLPWWTEHSLHVSISDIGELRIKFFCLWCWWVLQDHRSGSILSPGVLQRSWETSSYSRQPDQSNIKFRKERRVLRE